VRGSRPYTHYTSDHGMMGNLFRMCLWRKLIWSRCLLHTISGNLIVRIFLLILNYHSFVMIYFLTISWALKMGSICGRWLSDVTCPLSVTNGLIMCLHSYIHAPQINGSIYRHSRNTMVAPRSIDDHKWACLLVIFTRWFMSTNHSGSVIAQSYL
jgi:hypothetical protein